MSVDAIIPIGDTSQAVADQTFAKYLAEKKLVADELAVKAAAVQVAKVALEAKDLKKIDDEKSEEARQLKTDQAEKYQVTKETNKQALETKNARMDAVTSASASHFHATQVNSKAAQDKAIATIEQNTAVLEDFLAAKTSAAEVNRRADNALASDVANSNILNSKSETEHAAVAYHDNMAPQVKQQQAANATEAARLAGAATLTIRQEIFPTPHINVMD